MFTRWTSHISDPEEKQRFKNQIISAKPVLERLAQLIDEDEAALNSAERSVKQFDSPNWSWKQAYWNGARATLHSQKKIIDLDQQDTTNDRKFIRQQSPVSNSTTS